MAAIPAGDRRWAVAMCAALSLLGARRRSADASAWACTRPCRWRPSRRCSCWSPSARGCFEWRTLVSLIVLCILFIPIRRYQLPAALPVNLEPYRLIVGLVALAWLASALVQSDLRIRRTGFEGPLLAFGLAVLLGILSNGGRIQALDVNQFVLKKVTFFVSFALVMYMVASVVHSRRDIDWLVGLLVIGGAIVAGLAIVESRTGFNIFDHLQRVMPVLHFDASQLPKWTGERGGRVRAYASAQHAIALGAALAMLVPLAVYQGMRTRQGGWWIATGVLVLGTMATVSRTAMLMLLAEAVVFVVLKPASMKRMWPLLLPLLVVAHIAAPGTIGAFKDAFFPKGGLVAQQSAGAGTYGSGRLADLSPGIREWKRTPILGGGFGTRVTDQADPLVNAPILDDEWLGTLLETGAAGFLALLWLFARATRRLGRAARRDDSPRSWLTAGLAAAIVAFAVGMATYDAFSFIQVTFLLFILLGVAASELTLEARQPAAVRAPRPRGRAVRPVDRPRPATATI